MRIEPDQLRCRPDVVDKYCKNCKAWADHPNQPAHNARVMLSIGSFDQACFYMPISRCCTGDCNQGRNCPERQK